MEFTARISPDGKEVLLLYHDDSPLAGMGHKQVVRASNVQFNEKDQLWFVFERFPDGSKDRWPTGFAKRSDAIRHEIEMLEGRLLEEDLEYFKELFSLGG